MERKIIDIETYRLKKEAEDYSEWMDMKTGKTKKKSKNTSGKIEDLVKEIETDEFTLYRETKKLNILEFQGRYDLD